MEDHLIDARVKKAYERYNREKNPAIDSLALSTLNNFHHLIEGWQGSEENLDGIIFLKKFLTGPHIDAIAARGMAQAIIQNFEHIMTRKGTARKTAKLFCIRRDNSLGEGLASQIADVDFINYVVEHRDLEGTKPLLYTNRFLLSIFIEIMTTIADINHLNTTARLLGINPAGVSFEKLQIQIRSKVEDALKRQDIGNELTKFSRATIAYHIEN